MQAPIIGIHSVAAPQSAARPQTLAAAAIAGLLGTLLIWAVGFSPIAALHNAAHDTRHSMAFPCH
jgi:cobalt transporter subunit CbtB